MTSNDAKPPAPSPNSPQPNAPRQSGPSSEGQHARYSRRLAIFVGCLLVAWVGTLLPLPWNLISGVAALAGVVMAILVLVAAWPTDRRRSALFTAAVGIPACLILFATAAVTAAFYGPVEQFQECRSTALTDQAQQACEDELPGSISSWLRL